MFALGSTILAKDGQPVAAAPKAYDAPADFKPTEADFADRVKRGRYLGLPGFTGRALTKKKGVSGVFVMTVKLGQLDNDPIAEGDIIIGFDDKPLAKDPLIHFKQAASRALDQGGVIKITRWSKGTIKTFTLDLSPKIPDLTKGDKIDDHLNWILGSTGARGWIWSHKNSTELARQIYVTNVDKRSPAAGILQEGDVILGVGKGLFQSDPRKALAMAITNAEKDENHGKLLLTRWRTIDGKKNKAGTQETVTLKLATMGTFSKTAPFDCDKSKKIIENAVTALKQDGVGDGIPGVMNALGLMATGRRDVMPLVRAKMTEIAQTPVGGYKWGHAWCLIALSEYHLLTGDKKVLPAISRYALETARGQSINGTWGHDFAGEDGILIGYGTMNQLSIAHTIGLILAGKCGVTDPVVEQAVDKSIRFFNYFVGKGNVPYGGGEAGDQHGPDDNGKSSGCAVAFNLAGQKKGAAFFARHGVYDFSRIEIGHASNFFHLPWQGLASAHLGKKTATFHLRKCEWYYELLRDWRGKFRHHEDPNHKEPKKYWDATGARLLFFCLPLKKIYLTGKGGYLPAPVSDKELERISASSRHYGKYHTLSTEELFSRLGDWCHATRYRAAQALGKREGDWCERGITLYVNGTMNEKYGAARLFEAMGEKAAPAVDHLIKNVTHPDLWLRIRTVHALGAIGPSAARSAKPLLDAVSMEEMADHRNMFRRAIALALFDKKGILADKNALANVPRDTLIPALKILLGTGEAQSVSSLAAPLRKLSFDELKPLWPEIVYRAEHRCNQNVMFANMQTACIDLMAEHKVKEGLRLAGYMLFTQNGWGSNKRNKKLLAALQKYGTHGNDVLLPLQLYLQKNVGFGPDLQAFRETLKASKDTPQLKSIAPFLGDYEIGGHFEKLVTMGELRAKIAKKHLAEYWKVYEMCQGLLTEKPEWKQHTETVLAEMMAIPKAADIIKAHLAIEAIKQDFKDKKITREAAAEKLIVYRDKYDVSRCGPNLVYWFSLDWSKDLKSGRSLK